MKNNHFKPSSDDVGSPNNEDIDVRKALESHVYHWKWYVFSVIMFILLAFLYLRYTPEEFEVSSTIMIDDKDVGGLASEISAFDDLQLMSGSKTSITNEIGVLKSRSLIEQVIKDLKLNITYKHLGKILNNELYDNEIPIRINFLVNDSIIYNLSRSYTITPYSKTEYLFKNNDDESVSEGIFGKSMLTNFGEINITMVNQNIIYNDREIVVEIIPVRLLANVLSEKIEIQPQTVASSLITLKIRDNVQRKAADIIDKLVFLYNKNAIDGKKLVAENTDEFISERIDNISKDLLGVDLNVEDYKTKNKLVNLNSGVDLIMQSNSEFEKTIVELNSEIKLIDYLINYLETNPNDLIPANLGLRDNMTNQNTISYNTLLMERNRIISVSSILNPTVVNLDAQIATLKQSISQSLFNLKTSLDFSLSEARSQMYRLNSKISSAPEQERVIRDIQRQQQITETLYLYLLQKREENAISLVGISPNAKVIDYAQGKDYPVSPRPMMTLGIAILIGLIVPFSTIAINSIIDNKIYTIEDLEDNLDIPILGDIPVAKNNNIINFTNDNSNVAEAFRVLRSNLSFMFSNANNEAKTIFINSTIAGEGKTFITINLASVLATNNEKVLVIGADLRKPKIDKYLKIKSKKGLVNYLVDKAMAISDIIVSYEKSTIDIILSGDIPPNPTNLLMNGRFDQLMDYCKANYDYIIVDTAPVSLVADTLLLSHHADLSLYIVRANFLDKRLLNHPRKMDQNNRLPNMAILLNASNSKRNKYGYNYGYS